MELESALLYADAITTVRDGLRGLIDWTKTLEGIEHDEAVHRVKGMTREFHMLTVAMEDHNGGLHE